MKGVVMRKRTLVGIALVAGAVVSFAAHSRAGAHWGGGVFIDDKSRTFEGMMGGTHNSATSEFIGCRVESYDTGFTSAICEARDEAGTMRSCETTSPALIAAIHSIGDDDHVKIFYSGTEKCLQVRVSKYSSHVPKRAR
jgi:hypothetical protein